MDQHQETFQLTVQINPGLEPFTFTVTPEEISSGAADHQTIFKLSRDKDKDLIAVIEADSNHCWKQIKGNLDPQEVESIGAAIDVHFS